ncbi:MAG: M23 family metallopeptidase [Candidatus Glassbacteria bacterium]|nr:M23 family metallopeptidase [Candidatus Glassbacteria bacterium]
MKNKMYLMIFYANGRSRNIGLDLIRTAKTGVGLIVLCLVVFAGVIACNFYRLSDVRSRYSVAIQEKSAEETEIKSQLVALENFEEKISFFLGGMLDDGQNGNVGGAMGGGEEMDVVVENDLESASESSTLRFESRNYDSQTPDQRVDRLKVRLAELAALALVEKKRLDYTPSIMPSPGYMTSRFGWRRSPFTGQRHFHRGIDVVNKLGTPIKATASGEVVFSGKKEFWGNAVWIAHRDGIISKYGHMNELDVVRGEQVSRGQMIGKIGKSGRTTGPHLHYQIEIGHKAVDPMQFVIEETYN